MSSKKRKSFLIFELITIKRIFSSLAVIVISIYVFAGLADQSDDKKTATELQSKNDESSKNNLPELPEVEKPVPSVPPVGLKEDTYLDKTPPRQTRGLDLTKMGWTYNCMECHRLIESSWKQDRLWVEHGDIKLDHGANRFCLNCHHPKNRNAFVDYDGTEISQDDVVLLCAKCHGPTHRDWKAGVHGRRNGYWDKSKGPQTRLKCIQCHDPHSPKFKDMKPLAPPTYPERAPGKPETQTDNSHH
jgi:hypothetical protein